MTAEVEIVLADGHRAWLVSSSGEVATLRCTRAAPPGSTLVGESADDVVKIKVRRCVRAGDAFVVTGRFVDLSRVQRERLR